MTAAVSDPPPPSPPSPADPPLPSPLDILEAKRKQGQRQFYVYWTGERGWQVRCLGPVERPMIDTPPLKP
jgi:hypothetical protein